MEVGTVERGVVVRVDGQGKITISHAGLSAIECMGLLAMASTYLMNDLILHELPDTEALKSALQKAAA